MPISRPAHRPLVTYPALPPLRLRRASHHRTPLAQPARTNGGKLEVNAKLSLDRFDGVQSLPPAPSVRRHALADAFAPLSNVDFVACALWHGEPPADVASQLDTAQRRILIKEVALRRFVGDSGQTVTLPLQFGDKVKSLLLVGLGQPRLGGGFSAGQQIASAVAQARANHVVLTLPDERPQGLDAAEQLLRGLHLGAYRFDAFKSLGQDAWSPPRITIAAEDTALVRRAHVYAESVALARDLVNAPPNVMTPEAMATVAAREALRHGVTCTILEPSALAERHMNLLLAVGQASANTPRLVHLSYEPANADPDTPALALVGKGITFDSGGLDIKSRHSMLGMKADMGGAAAVLGAVIGAARLKAPVTVHGILALAENSIGPNAYRPGDIYESAAGMTVEITDTDAEGRLALADALHYASQLQPTQIIDVATLTGACIVALGEKTIGLFANDDTLAEDLLGSAALTEEPMWRLPLSDGLIDALRSPIADLKNFGGQGAGAGTAALFLSKFVDGVPWAHLDIAGPATSSSGATGAATATLLHHALKNWLPRF